MKDKSLEHSLSAKPKEVANLYLYGSEVFGNKQDFIKWLNLPNTVLGGVEPLILIETTEGISKVRNVLGRIEHGVYS